MSGLSIVKGDGPVLKDTFHKYFLDELGVDTVIDNVTRLNNNLFVVKMHRLPDKVAVMRNKYKLLRKNAGVDIYSDKTLDERYIARQINERAEVERIKGNTVKIGYMRLYINKEKWVWNDSQKKLVLKKERSIFPSFLP